MIKLSVIIPAYNEAENFQNGCLTELVEYLKDQKYSYEVIFVDDGSFDETQGLLSNFVKDKKNYQYLKIVHAGKLAAIKAGIDKAKGEIVLFTDFDQATPISEIENFLPEFDRGFDLVIGNRFGKAKRQGDNFISLLRSKLFLFLVRNILGVKVSDSQCGFKAFKNDVAKDLFNHLIVHKIKPIKKPFMGAFDAEVLFLAKKRKYKIREIPVSWQKIESKRLNLIDPLLMFLAIFKIRFADFLGHY